MRKVELDCKIVVPLFMGNASQTPELRTQSFNGLFRYWFRLLGGSFDEEKRLFGWGGEKAEKGLVSLSIRNQSIKTKVFEKVFDLKDRVAQGVGINYIGFSLDQRFKKDQNKPRREYLERGSTFTLIFRFHPKAGDSDVKKFLSAVWCAFYLGNFGSRSRRGFGSIVVENINGEMPNGFNLKFRPENNQNIGDWLKEQIEFIKDLGYWKAREDIPYIFENLEIWKVEKNNYNNYKDWVKEVQNERNGKYLVNEWALDSIKNKNNLNKNDLLDFMGFLLMAYRSYYQPDYQIAKNIISGANRGPNQIIERAILGLPLNFYFSSIGERGKGGQVEVNLSKDEKGRRASPLIFKIIKFDNEFDGFILVFKPNKKRNFKFLPDNATINLRGVNLNKPNWEFADSFVKVVDSFINTLEKNRIITEITYKRLNYEQ